jgi:hypothetical protein
MKMEKIKGWIYRIREVLLIAAFSLSAASSGAGDLKTGTGVVKITPPPGEIFTELGLYLKSRSPYPHTIVIGLANGSIDYIPDMKAFTEGNYEPLSARCAPGSGEILVGNVLRILNDMKKK